MRIKAILQQLLHIGFQSIKHHNKTHYYFFCVSRYLTFSSKTVTSTHVRGRRCHKKVSRARCPNSFYWTICYTIGNGMCSEDFLHWMHNNKQLKFNSNYLFIKIYMVKKFHRLFELTLTWLHLSMLVCRLSLDQQLGNNTILQFFPGAFISQ